jgi:hypothetical protein
MTAHTAEGEEGEEIMTDPKDTTIEQPADEIIT